jgi:glutathione S-transferase
MGRISTSYKARVSTYKLIIGNKTYSTWSLRPWLVLKHFGFPFEEILVKLDLPGTTEEILKYSPSGRVPALVDGGTTVWESLAILEYLYEKHPEIYPKNRELRALARSLSNEMHAGFGKMRELLNFNAKKKFPGFDWSGAQKDIGRVVELWESALRVSRGPFLCGDFSVADAMFAPVVGRFVTYDVQLQGAAAAYAARIMELPAMREWYADAKKENFVAEQHEL